MWTRRAVLSGLGQVGAALGVSGALRGWAQMAGAGASAAPSQSIAGAASLGAHAAARGRLYGSAVDAGLLHSDPRYTQVLAEQCRIVVAENAMKWGPLRPTPDSYRWDDADALLQFAEGHGMKVRGHNLCWHEQLPRWFAATATSSNAADLLTSHIRAVAGRYRGRIRAWDVVNEAIKPEDGKPDGLRDSPWFRLLGSGYIELAFRTARATDPGAMLTYNDYDLEYDNPPQVAKRAAVLALVKRLKAASLIDAVGIQSHLTADSPNAMGPGLRGFLDELHALGLKVFVTEMDVNDDRITSDDPAVRDKAVAAVYRDFTTLMVTHPAVEDVLTWGISDNHTWLDDFKEHRDKHPGRGERPLPLDADYNPTPAFYALRGALDAGLQG